MIWLGILLFVLGGFVASQNTGSKIAAPLMTVGVVLILARLFGGAVS